MPYKFKNSDKELSRDMDGAYWCNACRSYFYGTCKHYSDFSLGFVRLKKNYNPLKCKKKLKKGVTAKKG